MLHATCSCALYFTGAKEKSGNRTSRWGPAFTVGGIECNCKKCGLVSEAVIANAMWRQFKGELVCPPHCGSSGGANCQSPLQPTEQGQQQLAEFGMQGAKWVNTKTLNERKRQGKL
jgi:hypothetical protein